MRVDNLLKGVFVGGLILLNLFNTGCALRKSNSPGAILLKHDKRIIKVSQARNKDFINITDAYDYAKTLKPSEKEQVLILIYPGFYKEDIKADTPYINFKGTNRNNVVWTGTQNCTDGGNTGFALWIENDIPMKIENLTIKISSEGCGVYGYIQKGGIFRNVFFDASETSNKPSGYHYSILTGNDGLIENCEFDIGNKEKWAMDRNYGTIKNTLFRNGMGALQEMYGDIIDCKFNDLIYAIQWPRGGTLKNPKLNNVNSLFNTGSLGKGGTFENVKTDGLIMDDGCYGTNTSIYLKNVHSTKQEAMLKVGNITGYIINSTMGSIIHDGNSTFYIYESEVGDIINESKKPMDIYISKSKIGKTINCNIIEIGHKEMLIKFKVK